MILTKIENTLSVVMAPSEIDYSGKRAWCAKRIYHELPGLGATTWVVTQIEGRIGNLSVELTKAGLAGVEATFRITTGEETSHEVVVVEVLGWWLYGYYQTGVCIYDYSQSNPNQGTLYAEITAGQVLRYNVTVHPLGIGVRILDLRGKTVFERRYLCQPKRILRLQAELEYWRYYEDIGGEKVPRTGRFSFNGEVTLDRLYREGVGWVNADVCSYYLDTVETPPCTLDLLTYDHYKDGGSWIFKGEVRDE